MLKLRKLDYTRHPYSKKIKRVSIMDYKPNYNNYNNQIPNKPTDNPLPNSPEMEGKKEVRKKPSGRSLYSSAKPPDEF